MPSPASEIEQGYLTIAADGAETRVRRRGERCFLTVKSPGGLVRGEREVEISTEQFETLWPATEGRRVEKVRRVLHAGDGIRIELDVYRGALTGLIVAEVEFDGRRGGRTALRRPHWFGREVTGEARLQESAAGGVRSALTGRTVQLIARGGE